MPSCFFSGITECVIWTCLFPPHHPDEPVCICFAPTETTTSELEREKKKRQGGDSLSSAPAALEAGLAHRSEIWDYGWPESHLTNSMRGMPHISRNLNVSLDTRGSVTVLPPYKSLQEKKPDSPVVTSKQFYSKLLKLVGAAILISQENASGAFTCWSFFMRLNRVMAKCCY